MKKGIRKMLSAIACAALAMGCLAGAAPMPAHPQQAQQLKQRQKMLQQLHPKLPETAPLLTAKFIRSVFASWYSMMH